MADAEPCTRCHGTGVEPPPARLLVDVTLLIRTVSEANKAPGGRNGKIQRKRYQRLSAAAMLRRDAGDGRDLIKAGPVSVTLTRIAPRELDAHDNLPTALKHVTDGVADWLGLDDRDERVTWEPPQQESRGAGVYAVRVEVRERNDAG